MSFSKVLPLGELSTAILIVSGIKRKYLDILTDVVPG